MIDNCKIPPGWTRKKIDDILVPISGKKKIQQGWSPQCKKTPASHGAWGVLKTTAVQPGSFRPEHNKELPENLEPREAIEIAQGDLLITCAGPRSRCGIPCLVKQTPSRLMMSGKMYRFRPVSEISGRFLVYQLLSRRCQDAIDRMKTGISDSGLNLTHSRFLDLAIVYPCFGDQEDIADAIDKHWTAIDAIEKGLQAIQAKLKQARASILKAAVEGRLVEREAELARVNGRQLKSGKQLLAEISNIAKMVSSQKRNTATNKDATGYPGPIEIDGLALPMPSEGWAWSTMGDIASIVRNGYSGKPADQGPVKILRISAVRPLSVDHTDTRSLPGSISVYGKAIAREGCLLITRYNGNPSLVGVMGHYRSRDPVVHPDKLIRVELASPTIRPEWIEIAFNTGITRARLQKRVRTTAGQAGISGQDVKSMPVPVPPTEEQIRIIQEVQRRFSVLDQVEATVQTSLDGCGILRQAILKRAFE